jgi:hypothetical protein
MDMKLRRSLENEYNLTSKELARNQDARSISPERINKILNKLPPFPTDMIPEEDIESFSKKGFIGWNYLTQ